MSEEKEVREKREKKNSQRDIPNRKRNKKKGRHPVLLTVCLVFLAILLLLLGFLIWQLIRLNNGEDFIIKLPGAKTTQTRELPEEVKQTAADAAETAAPAGESQSAQGTAEAGADTQDAGSPADAGQSEPAQAPAAAPSLNTDKQAILAASKETVPATISEVF